MQKNIDKCKNKYYTRIVKNKKGGNKMKKIKWENIAFIMMLVYGAVAMLHHTYNELSLLEIPVYLGQALLVRYSVKYVRTNTKDFINEIINLFNE